MHQLSCLVALTGDVMNKFYLDRITTPELMLLRLIHGENSITDIRVIGDVKYPDKGTHMREEYARLLHKYPRYVEQVTGIWRDSGGKFIESVHELSLSSALFASDRDPPRFVELPPDIGEEELQMTPPPPQQHKASKGASVTDV
jgi:hypothetical protein